MNFILEEYPYLYLEYKRLIQLDISILQDILSSQITSLMRRLEDIYEIEHNFRIMYSINRYTRYMKENDCLCKKSEFVFNYISIFPIMCTILIPIKEVSNYIDCNISYLISLPNFLGNLYHMFKKYIKTDTEDVHNLFNYIKRQLGTKNEKINVLISTIISNLPFNYFCNCDFALSLGNIPKFIYYEDEIYYNEKGLLIVPKHEVNIKHCGDTCKLWYELLKGNLPTEVYLNHKKLI